MSEELDDLLERAMEAHRKGELDSAFDLYSQTLEKAKAQGINEFIAVSLYNMGKIYEVRGELPEAMKNYQESLQYCENIEDPQYKATCLTNIGQLENAWGDVEKAIESLEESLRIWEQFPDDEDAQIAKSIALNAIGMVYNNIADFEKAGFYHQQALQIRDALGDLSGKAVSLNNLGMIELSLGRYDSALKYFEDAFNTYNQLKGLQPWGVPLSNMGEVYRIWGRFKEAEDYYNRALKIYEDLGDRMNKGVVFNNLGLLYVNWGKLDEALKWQEMASSIWEDAGTLRMKAITTNNIGDIYKLKGIYDKAMSCYQTALEIAKEIDAFKEQAGFLNSIGMIHVLTGKYDEALKFFQDALELTEKTKDIQSRGYALNNLGLVSQATGKYKDAINYYTKALETLGKAGDAQAKFTGENNIGEVYFAWGRYPKALESFQKALKDIEKLGFTKDLAVPLNNIGKVYLQWSQFDEALKYLSRGLEIAESIGNQRDIAISLNSVGLVYRTWGKYTEAIEHYTKAIKIQEKINDPHQMGTSINNLGECYIYQKQLDQGLEHFKKAQRVFEQVHDPRGISISINNIALVQQMQGSFQEAIEGYQKALQIAEELGDIHSTAVAYNNIALVYQAKEEYEKSIEYLEKGIEINRKLGDSYRESLAVANLGFSKWYQKNYKEALDLFIQAIDLQEGLTGKLKSEDVRISYRATQLGPYEAITEMLLDWYKQDGDESHLQDGLKFLELSKAREIVDKLESGRVQIETCPELHKLIDLEQKLVYEISQLEDMTASERRQGKVRSITLSELEEKGARLKEIRAELMEKCKDPGLTRVTKEYNPVPDYQELFKQEDVVIWEFLYFPNWWVYQKLFKILVWDANSIRVYNSNEFDKEALETLNREFHEKIALGTMKDTELAMKKLEELQKNLEQLFPDELYHTLENKKKLILIPHEVLHIFPWEIVERVGLALPVVRSYSLGLLRSCMKREKATKNILLIANPNYNIKELDLPGADLEVRSIKKVLKKGGHKPEILDHKEAVERAFEDLVKQEFGIIHFAGHGVYDPTNRDPWMSGLLFYRSDGYDMRTVTEIVGQRFNGAPLFILSACETGRSKFSQGDEMVGLIRGLTLAGATSIIATNWLLSDLVAPHFMKVFYENFLQGKDVCESLFIARKEVHVIYKEPVNWGVYTLFGNPFKLIGKL